MCAFENLARFQAREYLPFGKNEGITDRILTILESRPFSGHASGNASRSNLGGSEVRKFRKKTALATRTTHSSKRVAEPSYPRQPSNYFLVPTRGRSTRHYAASPPALCSFPPFLLFFSPIYIPVSSVSSIALPPPSSSHYASLTSEQVRPSTVVEAAERKVTTFLSSSFFLSFRARNKNTSASRK